jgi:DNA invertase Pin-like site-specific DNA recombinase
MTLAVSYLRFSSNKQQHGSSIERQKELLNSYLLANPELTLYSQNYSDLGLSAYHKDNLKGELGLFLEAVNKGKFPKGTKLLVEAIDRLSRTDASEAIHVLTGIINAGVEIVTLQDNTSYTKQSLNGGELYMLVGKIQSANQYSKTLSDRIKGSWTSKKKKAVNDGVRPIMSFPFYLDTKGDLKEGYQRLVQQMFEDYLAGLGQTKIAARLRQDESGLLPNIIAKTVKQLLANKMVLGYWQGAKVFPQVISDNLFNKVQYQLKKRSFKPTVTPRSFFMSGVAVCECGANLSFGGQGTHLSSKCNARSRKIESCDNNRSFNYKVFEFLHNRHEFEWKMLLREHQQQKADTSEYEALEGEITALQGSIDRLLDLLMKTDSKTVEGRLKVSEESMKTLLDKQHLMGVESSFAPDFLPDVETLDLSDEALIRSALIRCGYKMATNGKGDVTITIGDISHKYNVKKGFKKNGLAGYKLRVFDEGSKITWIV